MTAGVFASIDEACAGISLRPEVSEPDPERQRMYSEYHAVYRDLFPTTSRAMHRLSDLAGSAD